MDFTSIYFIGLGIISVFIFSLLKNNYRIVFLSMISGIFIATYSLNLLIYILVYALINYYIGIRIPLTKFKRSLFRIGILINLVQLILLKYVSFAINPILRLVNESYDLSIISEVIIPIGVSYFTLQGIGYLINVKMGWELPEKKIFNFVLYIIFFPKFLSGPIERSNHFLPQLNSLQFSSVQVTSGLRILLFGIFQKVAIANQLSPLIIGCWNNVDIVGGSSLWIILLLQPIYLYFDFSGYTNIAIGSAKVFGINLLPNFNRPFFSENMTSFWKRFHITLGAWFNDYIFKQVSFKRRKWGVYGSIYAILLTWLFFGIWHGGGWHFMLLGLLQASAVMYEYFTKKWRLTAIPRISGRTRIWLSRLFTYLFFCVSLVLFFAPDLQSVFTFFSRLNQFSEVPQLLDRIERIYFIVGVLFALIYLSFELIKNDFPLTNRKLEIIFTMDKRRVRLLRWTVYYVLILLIIVLSNSAGEFVYAQF